MPSSIPRIHKEGRQEDQGQKTFGNAALMALKLEEGGFDPITADNL